MGSLSETVSRSMIPKLIKALPLLMLQFVQRTSPKQNSMCLGRWRFPNQDPSLKLKLLSSIQESFPRLQLHNRSIQ